MMKIEYSAELHAQLRKRDKDSDASYVQCLLDEIERLQGESRWIPVSERLPEAGVNVLTCDNFETVTIFSLGYDKNCWLNVVGWEYSLDSVTHWMPLPKPPENKGKDNE